MNKKFCLFTRIAVAVSLLATPVWILATPSGVGTASETVSPLTGRPFRAEHHLPTSLAYRLRSEPSFAETSLSLQARTQFKETSFYLNDTDFTSSTVGWAVGARHWDQSIKAYTGTIIHTNDGGENWSTQTVPVADTLNHVDFVDERIGWAVGVNGTILHTTDGGAHWAEQTIATTDELSSVVFADARHGWATSVRPIHYDWQGTPDNWQAGIWYTGDGGVTWVKQAVPMGASILRDIDFVDTAYGWAVGVKYMGDDQWGHPVHRPVVYHTTNSGQAWNEVYSPDLPISVTAVDFVDATHGWAVGFPTQSDVEGGAVFHTANGGQTWSRQEPGGFFEQLWDVKFIDHDRGYVVGADYISAWGTPVWRTLDGGDTWENVKMALSDNDPFFGLVVDQERAIAVGHHDYVAISNDPWGPYSWPHGEELFTQGFINTHYTFEDVFFVDENHGWAVGRLGYMPEFTGQVILNTRDGGETWETQYENTDASTSLFSYLRLDSVHFVDVLNGWAVGVSENKRGAILHTRDGGQTWEEQGQELYDSWDLEFVDVKFLDHQEGWALACRKPGGNPNIFLVHTTDGGAYWEWVDTGIEGNICVGFGAVMGALDFLDDQHGWVVGSSAVIRTVDGGATWSAQSRNCEYGPIDCPQVLNAIDMIDIQAGWIAGEESYRTGNGGLHWDWELADAGWLNDVQFLDAENGWIGGDGYVAYTTDGGNTWTPLDDTDTPDSLLGLSFVSPDKGWLVGNHGTILNVKYEPVGESNCSEEAKLWIRKVYIGYYDRCAEFGGFDYWCKRLDEDGGGSHLSSIIAAFGTSQEYTDRFSELYDSELINNLYQNMFDRDVERAGLEFYLGLLESRRQEWRDIHGGADEGATEYALSRIALDVLNGAQGQDLVTLNGKVSACPQY